MVRTDSFVPKSQSVNLTVLEYDERYSIHSKAAQDFRILAADLVEEEDTEEREAIQHA